MREQQGFTLVELLLSLLIIFILGAISIPAYGSVQSRNNLSLKTRQIADLMRQAQAYSRANYGDGQWGFRVQAGSATLFKGASYASRDQAYDETVSLPNAITPSGLSEVLFSVPQGEPATTGTVTLTTNTNETRTITLNAKGMVTY